MFKPKRVIFEDGCFSYPLGKNLYNYFQSQNNIEIIRTTSNNIKRYIPGEDYQSQYQSAKETLAVGIKKSLRFETCKPSAHYQLPLAVGCMGRCEYCYLNTRFSEKAYIKIYANLPDILNQTEKYIRERLPDTTVFEGAANCDLLPLEPYTHILKDVIEFFASNKNGLFRFVSKYCDIDDLVGLNHKGHTEIRFSVNTDSIISNYEHYTPNLRKRLQAAGAMAASGYPVGFIVAPVIVYKNWQEDYYSLLVDLKNSLPSDLNYPPTFEVISHRFTLKARDSIRKIYPHTLLPMDEAERQFKFGQFGYGKYLYDKETLAAIRDFFKNNLTELFPQGIIKYII